MSERATGWAFVGIQAALLAALILLPSRADFEVPEWVRTMADIVFWVGVGAAVVAGFSLGRALTATPVPTATGSLRTGGLYRFVRHPIYTGVLLIVVAIVARSGSFVSVAIGVVTVGFFHIKAAWEEARLTERYPEYAAYAARTPRFVPNPRRMIQRST